MSEAKIKRLNELVEAITRTGKFEQASPDRISSEFYMRIPAEPDHDADLVISWAVSRIEELEAENQRLKEQLRPRDPITEPPTTGIRILVHYTNSYGSARTVIGMLLDQHQEEIYGEDCELCGEWSEEHGLHFFKAGWYELCEYESLYCPFDKPEYWLPIPEVQR